MCPRAARAFWRWLSVPVKVTFRCVTFSTFNFLYVVVLLIRPIGLFSFCAVSFVFVCPCWHSSLTKTQTKQLEDVQRRALQVIFGNIQ